jgi:hypothetical protein
LPFPKNPNSLTTILLVFVLHSRQLEVESRESLVFGGLQRLKDFKLPVNEWVSADKTEAISFQHSGDGQGAVGKKGERMTAKVEKGGQRSKTALEIIVMPNVGLDTVEAVMSDDDAKKIEAADDASRRYRGEQERDVESSLSSSSFTPVPGHARDTVEAMAKYAKYLERQIKEMEHWRKNQAVKIPDDMKYTLEALPSLSAEEVGPTAVFFTTKC